LRSGLAKLARQLKATSLFYVGRWTFDVGRSSFNMFDVGRSFFICTQGVDSSLKYVESEFTPGQ